MWPNCKGEIAHNEQFLLWPQCFQHYLTIKQETFQGFVKVVGCRFGDLGKGLNTKMLAIYEIWLGWGNPKLNTET